MTTINSGLNTWATEANQALRNQTANADTFHAIYNGITMNGGAGADTYRIKAGTTGSTIEHFNFADGDRIKIDGLKNLDPSLLSVSIVDGNYVVKYGAEGDANHTSFSFWQPLDATGAPLTLTAEEFKAKLTNANPENNYVQLGGLDPLADYVTGFESIELAKLATQAKEEPRTFEITGERPLYIEGFSANKNRNKLLFSSTLPDNIPLWVGQDLNNNITIKQGDKVLAQLSAPEGTTSLDTWAKNTIFEIRAAAKKEGLQISNR